MPSKGKKGKAKSGSVSQPAVPPPTAPILSTAYLFPGFHDDVLKALSDDGVPDLALPEFNLVGTEDDATHIYNSTIQADFQCINPSCKKTGWASGVVSITIRRFPDKSYNAVVYNQRCKRCEQLGFMIPNGTYTARVSYRLKKWMGWRMDPPPYHGEGGVRTTRGPHEEKLCEGCKAGVCENLEAKAGKLQGETEGARRLATLEREPDIAELEALMMAFALAGRAGPPPL
ncbi:zinc-binding domain-containing protein [Cladorrhinum samala]|uniref:Zinc-binding domain-containing protein n=1 Tax=Cladorrhinum samala TaxID=585594 RepID=A0AAV9HHW9_9PEZI|nr:zinc-binding domain-containing protein [Cladorrhinum samala]